MVATNGDENIFIHFVSLEWDWHHRYSIAIFQTFVLLLSMFTKRNKLNVLKRLWYAFWVLCYVAFAVHVKDLQREKAQNTRQGELFCSCTAWNAWFGVQAFTVCLQQKLTVTSVLCCSSYGFFYDFPLKSFFKGQFYIIGLKKLSTYDAQIASRQCDIWLHKKPYLNCYWLIICK